MNILLNALHLKVTLHKLKIVIDIFFQGMVGGGGGNRQYIALVPNVL